MAYEAIHTVGRESGWSTVELTDELPAERRRIVVETELLDVGLAEAATFAGNACYDVVVEYTGEDVVYWQSDGAESRGDRRSRVRFAGPPTQKRRPTARGNVRRRRPEHNLDDPEFPPPTR